MLYQVKRVINWLTEHTLSLLGRRVLTREQTTELLAPYRLVSNPPRGILVPAVSCPLGSGLVLFEEMDMQPHSGNVWHYRNGEHSVWQLPYGNIWLDRSLLCTNFGNHHLAENVSQLIRRSSRSVKVLLAPWSHYLDGIAFGGYYDFVLLVAAHLCRMKDALPESVFAEAVVSYPLFGTAYEREYLSLLGITPDRIVDSRRYAIRSDEVVLGNHGHWFYPNATDILSLKKHVETALKPVSSEKKRLYISRSGRRKVANETELIQMLKKYDFTVVDDKTRTVAEQVDLYRNASFIIGPHGASFTNIIWCEPGTHLFELFSPSYLATHFVYLATVMQLQYSAYYETTERKDLPSAIEADMHVSIDELDRCLSRFFVEPEVTLKA